MTASNAQPEDKSGTSTERILYLSHADWSWIKQRPQFMAEGLALAGASPLFAYVPAVRRRRLTANPSFLPRVPLPITPRWTHRLDRRYNLTVGLQAVRALIAWHRPSVVWVTFPSLIRLLPTTCRATVVYDAMDIAAGFARNAADRALLDSDDSEAIRRAHVIFASSARIAEHLHALAELPPGSVHVLPNAYDDRQDWNRSRSQGRDMSNTTFGYIGTIGPWVDLEALDAIASLPLADVHIVGPLDVQLPPSLVYRGVVPHSEVPAIATQFDCFLLPFVPSALVEGVDPVKLYEYVAMGKPIIARYYPALDKFREVVHFYSTTQEFLRLAKQVQAGSLAGATPERRSRFLEENTWRARGSAAMAVLREL